MSIIEILGFVTGAVNVWMLSRQNIWNWPLGIANNLLYLFIFIRTGLYADSGLQIIYVVLSAWGWYVWLRRDASSGALKVTRTTGSTWFWMVPMMAAGAILLRTILARYTDSVVPGWDGATAAISLGATYGQCRKLLESWWLWILADVIYIPLYVYKGLSLTAVLYSVFLVLCVIGLRDWHRAWRVETNS